MASEPCLERPCQEGQSGDLGRAAEEQVASPGQERSLSSVWTQTPAWLEGARCLAQSKQQQAVEGFDSDKEPGGQLQVLHRGSACAQVTLRKTVFRMPSVGPVSQHSWQHLGGWECHHHESGHLTSFTEGFRAQRPVSRPRASPGLRWTRPTLAPVRPPPHQPGCHPIVGPLGPVDGNPIRPALTAHAHRAPPRLVSPGPDLHPTGPSQSLALFLAGAGGVDPNNRQGNGGSERDSSLPRVTEQPGSGAWTESTPPRLWSRPPAYKKQVRQPLSSVQEGKHFPGSFGSTWLRCFQQFCCDSSCRPSQAWAASQPPRAASFHALEPLSGVCAAWCPIGRLGASGAGPE